MAPSQYTRVSIGFQGGQVLSVRVTAAHLEALHGMLGEGGWHQLETEDGPVRLYLGQVVYVRTEDGDQRVGFSA
jgi:hypothetical protein